MAASGQVWKVVGGEDKGGILVRQGQELKSGQCLARLSTGALVMQLELVGERLHYHKISGTGPDSGWVSTKLGAKDLLVKNGENPAATSGKSGQTNEKPAAASGRSAPNNRNPAPASGRSGPVSSASASGRGLPQQNSAAPQSRNNQMHPFMAQPEQDQRPPDDFPADPAAAMGPPARDPREWQERKGYRMRAPDERVQAESRRIHEQEERNARLLQEEKRAQGLQIVRQSRGGKLGAGEGGTTGMQEARLALVEKLERESNPKLKRMQRKEEERREREEELRKREEVEKQRLDDWNERQKVKAAQDNELNKVKQSHWQSWGNSGGSDSHAEDVNKSPPENLPSPSSSSYSADDMTSRLPGKWQYGSKPNEYNISANGNFLLFDGPDPAGGRLSGLLKLHDDHFEAELTNKDGSVFGTMSFSLRQQEGDKVNLVTRFKKAGKTEWGKENLACKVVTEKSSVGSSAARASQDGTSEEYRAPMQTGYQDCLIDPDLWQCQTCTFINEADAIECGACGSPRPRRQPVQPVLRINAKPVVEAPKSPEKPPTSEMGHAAEADMAETEELLPPQPPAGPPTLIEWLQANRLDEYYEALVEAGFEELDDLREAEPRELDDLFTLLNIKPGHMGRFRRALRGGSGEGAVAAS